jgi:hypothetical protein
MEQKPKHVLAPELEVSRWFNTNEPLTLGALRGRPVLLHTFQMLCPGCVVHAIPQAQKIHGMLRILPSSVCTPSSSITRQ